MNAQPCRPTVTGEICVYRSPLSDKVWLADQAEFDSCCSLRWAAMDQDDPVVKAAIHAYQCCKDLLSSSPTHPEIRNTTICEWAANLAAQMLRTGQSVEVNRAPQLAIGMTAGSGVMAFERAVMLGLEPEIANLAEIERMMRVANKEGIVGVQPSLCDLRNGFDPSGGMFTQIEQITAIKLQYPVLASENEIPLIEAACDTRATSTMRLR